MAEKKDRAQGGGDGSPALDEQETAGSPRSGANGETKADGAPRSDGQADAGGLGDGSPAIDEGGTAAGGAELSTLRERYLRLAAEFDNYRKRVERERSEGHVRAQATLLERLLEPLDDLQRIADFDPETTPSGALHEGAEMVERKFLRAMEAAGMEEIDAAGKPFDPAVHEALTTVPTTERDEDDMVAQVYQKGYRFRGILLRPARVVVKKFQG
jgi:molecular chaperone GrpE